jgi:very-short-patch-repair endonuclease
MSVDLQTSINFKKTQCAKEDSLQELIIQRIETLRPKLLDFSRRNPLVYTKLSHRSSSHIRVVDELPEVLMKCLSTQKEMQFASLPALDEDPKDESTKDFQTKLSAARLNDEIFKAAADLIDPESEDGPEEYRKLERKLRDQVREQIGLSKRQLEAGTSLKQHAINNGIRPDFDLPTRSQQNEDGRHTDTKIQMLLLPSELERKLNGLITKNRSWIQETGINVLYAAFGFLEWTDKEDQKQYFAPLVMMPVEMKKVKTGEGNIFKVVGTAEVGEINAVLQEKLRLDFGIVIPAFTEETNLEDYFQQIGNMAPKAISWTVRRQCVFGIFPSARIAMYHDLDTQTHSSGYNASVTKLLAGSNSTAVSVFGDDYLIDKPEVENKVPYLVLDADSSQFSTIVDIADGKDLAVEGPPGTGKSQTIVNTIAAMLEKGKKVLFVAEKSAALNVVKSRLTAVGLGEFVLALQAEKSTREQVLQSVQSRMDMKPSGYGSQRSDLIASFNQTRYQLQAYIDVISSDVGKTGILGFEVLGKTITHHKLIEDYFQTARTVKLNEIQNLDRLKIQNILEIAKRVKNAWSDTLQFGDYWSNVKLAGIDRFKIDRIVGLLEEIQAAFVHKLTAEKACTAIGLNAQESSAAIDQLTSTLRTLEGSLDEFSPQLAYQLCDREILRSMTEFRDQCTAFFKSQASVHSLYSQPPSLDTVSELHKLREFSLSQKIDLIDVEALKRENEKLRLELELLEQTDLKLRSFVAAYPNSSEWSLSAFPKIKNLLRGKTGRVLSLRHKNSSLPEAPDVLKRCSDAAKMLKSTRERLEANIAISRASQSSDDIFSHAQSLKSGGFFAQFGSDFKKAKKFYQSVSKRADFDKHTAANDLHDLIDHSEKQQKFLDDKELVEIFGKKFDIDTDFQPFHELVEWHLETRGAFPGFANLPIRQFLETAPLDLLEEVPTINEFAGSETHASLASRMLVIKKDIELREFLYDELLPFSKMLLKPTEFDVTTCLLKVRDIETLFETRRTIEANVAAQQILGSFFEGVATDPAKYTRELEVAMKILELDAQAPLAREAMLTGNFQTITDSYSKLQRAVREFEVRLIQFIEMTGIDLESAVDTKTPEETENHLRNLRNDEAGLRAFSRFYESRQEFEAAGLGTLLDSLSDNHAGLTDIEPLTEALIYRGLAEELYSKNGSVLSKFPGHKLNECRAKLARLDRDIIKLSQGELQAKIFRASRFIDGIGSGKKSEWTQMPLINNELGKKKRFISVRDLTHRAGAALLELKPCWMMSPLAVAQYVQKEDLVFDLVIIDEASQMPPENALGALLRAKQVMVVGDTNQLPPSTFFRSVVEDEDADEDEAVLEESILEMANGAYRPQRRLRWHYRSRHSGLINFSNHMVYNDDLIVFPSANEGKPDMGVSFVKVEGRYSVGTNSDEARVVIDAAIKFMKDYPDRSLGIVTLNKKQMELIQEGIDFALTKDAAAARYVEKWAERNEGLEQFFVKNLENVQGDERDVIYISTVYGAESPGGPVMQRFGPINGLSGKRRLNVLFSRAKLQIVTFSSMTSADIKAEESTNAGVYMLKRWLEYSVNGIIHAGTKTNKSSDSDFEDYVMNQIRSMGFEVEPQVGVSGYFIDIGVKHPDYPHGFLIGVECDGANYHSSRSARDRDRLRQEVLENLGWKFHRIWSTDWFNDPRKESEKLRCVLTERLNQLKPC